MVTRRGDKMSNYINSVAVTAKIKAAEANAVVQDIKILAMTFPDHYGWKSEVLSAKTIWDLAKAMDIKLVDEGDGLLTPQLENTYKISLFEEIMPVMAKHMTNGYIWCKDYYSEYVVYVKEGEYCVIGIDDFIKIAAEAYILSHADKAEKSGNEKC